MNKAFAIKNKEGKYLDNCQDFETTNIYDARLFDDYEEALSFSPKDCEVVKVTINEEQVKNYNVTLTYAYGKEYVDKLKEKNKKLTEANKQLKQQLKEKDKQLEQLDTMIKTLPNHDTEIELQIRKQVCNKIRDYDRITNKQKTSYTEYVIGLCEILNQIEQGE